MIKLYGALLSNYDNRVKVALLEKWLPLEAILTKASQDGAYLQKRPMGKIPCIEGPEGFLAESIAILEYLKDVGPSPALLPGSPFERARPEKLRR